MQHKEPLRTIYTLQYVPRLVAQSSTKKKNPLTELQGKHKKVVCVHGSVEKEYFLGVESYRVLPTKEYCCINTTLR